MTRDIYQMGNLYGPLSVKQENGKFFWSIECSDGHDWVEIPESLYIELVKYDESKRRETKI